jgi:3'-phosphoadenosine 5'-phosphosulfate sulfotransferase (PAPS reductase)/FAD synthetase
VKEREGVQLPFWMPTAEDLALACEKALGLVRQAKAEHGPIVTVCLFSGGNDSSALLHLVREEIDYAGHIDTGTGIPQTREFVEQTAKALGVPLLVEETPPSVYEDLVMANGFPGPALHYIHYTRLKERRLDEWKRRFAGRRGKRKILFLTGLRVSESARRKMHIGQSGPIHRAAHTPRIIFCNPIMDFSVEMLMAYKETHSVPRNPVADLLHMSGECLCGAYAKPDELKEIGFWFPEVEARIRALEARVKAAGQKRCQWGHGSRDGARPTRPVGDLCQSCELFPVTA